MAFYDVALRCCLGPERGEIAVAYRPSHADATYDMKYGVRAIAGGGRSSARETIGRVAAGAIAKKVLKEVAGTEILAYVSQVRDVVATGRARPRPCCSSQLHSSTVEVSNGMNKWMQGQRDGGQGESLVPLIHAEASLSETIGLKLNWHQYSCEALAAGVDHENMTMDDVEANIARCPDAESATRMIDAIDEVRVRGDSCGGVVTCIVRNCPRGLGAPVFDKLEADLAKAMMSLPATKGFEIGSGFGGANTTGSTHNDEFYMGADGLHTRTNRSGGVQGGISNGEIIELKIAFKPTSTITQKQQTVNRDGVETELRAKVRLSP